MASIVNIPYLTSGRQLKCYDDKSKNTKNDICYQNQATQDKITKRRYEYLKLSESFKDAYNYRTFGNSSK